MALAECPVAVSTPQSPPKLPPDSSTDSVRRSTRARRGVKKLEDEDYVVTTPSKAASRQPNPAQRATRPKRKAAVISTENDITEDGLVLLEQVVSHMAPEERSEYKGWVELESEPVFFNAMLHLLGADDFKVQEMFGVDEFSLALLLKPVHGLIYLYEYAQGSHVSGERQDYPPGLWFGNQTTTNACATVALMNIIMNARDASLGAELQTFRDSTMPLEPPQRGHILDRNDWIRCIHNSAARRMDLVSEDLLLDNKFEAADEARRVQSRKKASRLPRIRKRTATEQSFHYIAYVPVNGRVWELDGFEVQPRCLGPFGDTDDWLGVASTSIQQRMEGQQCSLLAVCQSPIRGIVEGLEHCNVKLHAADQSYAKQRTTNTNDNHACDHGPEVPDHGAPTSFAEKMNGPAVGTCAKALYHEAAPRLDSQETVADGSPLSQAELSQVRGQQAALKEEYATEITARSEGLELLRARQHGYLPAVHRWVRLLSEKGELRDLMAEAADTG